MDDWQTAEEHVDRGLELYHRGKWSDAEHEFRKAIDVDPTRGDWHFNLGLALEAAGRDAEAVECFQHAAKLLPDEVEPWIAAGSAAIRLGRAVDALPWLERASAIDPKLEIAYARRIEALTALDRHDDAETVYFLAQSALEEYPLCLKAMGEDLMRRGQLDRAGWCFREALRQDPTLLGVRSRLAAVLAATGRPNRALQMYLQDLRDDPGNIDTLLSYGRLLADLKRHPEAGEKFRRVLELEPANAEAHWHLGELAERAGRLEQARGEYELALQLDPERPDAHLVLADVRLRAGHRPEALRHLAEQCQRVLEQDSPSPVSIRRTAELLLDAGAPSKAVEVLEKLRQLSLRDPELLRLLAFARFAAGDVSGGASLSRRVLRLDPTCVRAIHNLSLAALEEGRLRLAWGWWRKGTRISPHDDGLRRLRTRLVLAGVSRTADRLHETFARPFGRMRRAIDRLRRQG